MKEEGARFFFFFRKKGRKKIASFAALLTRSLRPRLFKHVPPLRLGMSYFFIAEMKSLWFKTKEIWLLSTCCIWEVLHY